MLLTPLDWGLGHASRCIPVIRELQRQGCEVLIAGSGEALELLRKEFDGHAFFRLSAYAPRYSRNGSMSLTMARQLPHFINVITSEHREVERIIEKESIDIIISDNRYGCWSQKIPSVLITHQSNVLMPFAMMQAPVRKVTESLINRFDNCWIPDLPEGDSLSGALTSFGKIRVKPDVTFIGWLSRFEKSDTPQQFSTDVLAIFSGPEPQREIFENILVPQLKNSGLRFRVVRGLASTSAKPDDPRIVNFLASRELQEWIQSSAAIIARSGYSTIMDMQALGKKAIFVPTPGQTEQEYLASRLMEKGIAFSMPQKELDLHYAMDESKKYTGFSPPQKNQLLREAVQRLMW